MKILESIATELRKRGHIMPVGPGPWEHWCIVYEAPQCSTPCKSADILDRVRRLPVPCSWEDVRRVLNESNAAATLRRTR